MAKAQGWLAAGVLLAVVLTGCAGGGAEPEATASGEATPIDGTYRWSTTEEQAIGTAAEEGIGELYSPDSLPAVPNTFTLELDRGEWTWQGIKTKAVDRGLYTVDGDTLEITWLQPRTGWTLTFEYTADPDGTLHMRSIGEMEEPVNEFVWTHNPWVKIG